MVTGYTIPYQLRPHKAIERNLFLSILKGLDRCQKINLSKYRYVGFGAPFLEDFKLMHIEFGINDMDCIENNSFAFSRQKFNNPYSFVNLFNKDSTEYISGPDFKENKNQVVWLDYATPGQIRQQLTDIELMTQKVSNFDILKFTFNANPKSFASSHHMKGNWNFIDNKKLLSFMKSDTTYQLYFPDHFTSQSIAHDFSIVLRAMALRAAKRGLSKGNNDLDFNHISSFTYADGQAMTTVTGIVCKKEELKSVLEESDLKNWQFYQPDSPNEIINSNHILVPAMTILERIAIDKLIPPITIDKLIQQLEFNYGGDIEEHKQLLEGYCKYYKFLPYYSKVTY